MSQNLKFKKLKNYLPSLIKIAIANRINSAPIAMRMIDKIFDIPKSLSGKLLCTVVVLVVEELLLDEEVVEEVFVLEVFDVFELLEVLELLEVFDVLEVLEVFDVLDDVFWLSVSLMFISTAKTFVVKDNNINNITIIENFFKFLIIFYTSIENKKIYLKFFTIISQILKICLVFFKKCKKYIIFLKCKFK